MKIFSYRKRKMFFSFLILVSTINILIYIGYLQNKSNKELSAKFCDLTKAKHIIEDLVCFSTFLKQIFLLYCHRTRI